MRLESTENYLKAIYALEQRQPLVAFKSIVMVLGVTAGTATTMMKRLAKRGLVHYQARQGVRLTNQGRNLALQVLRRHRLLELFLVKIVGLNWSQVHQEAEVLEHVISPTLLNAMDKLLGHPDVDPHGAPIPSAAGKLPRRQKQLSLADVAAGQKFILRQVAEDAGILQFLDTTQLQLGDVLQLLHKDPAAGILTIQGERRRRTHLSLAVAQQLWGEVAGSK